MQGSARISLHAASTPSEVRVSAPARLHFGFVDLHGGLGRRFGSLGLAIDRPGVRLRARRSTSSEIVGPAADRVQRALDALQQHYDVAGAVRIDVEETIQAHAGLGSGTQIALATAQAVCALSGIDASVKDLARCMERGARSGIGAGVFQLGGFVVDGGRGELDAPPPVISRLPFPEDWRVVLLFDPELTGLHGDRETAAFRDLPRFPERQAEHLARSVLMQLLPALAESRIEAFGAALTELQQAIGDHFAPAQGGRFASQRVEQALLRVAGRVAAYGQSSWGPTGFAIVASQGEADAVALQLRDGQRGIDKLSIQIARGCNRGAQCHPVFSSAARPVTA